MTTYVLNTPATGAVSVRSGLLREPTVGTVEFVHRTFQAHLGAKAAVEDGDFGLLVRNAVERNPAPLVPPPTTEESRRLASCGPFTLELLPGPDGLTDARPGPSSSPRLSSPRTPPSRSSPASAPIGRPWAAMGSRAQLAWSWHRFGTRRYGEEVVGDIGSDELGAALQPDGLLKLVIRDSRVLGGLDSLSGQDRIRTGIWTSAAAPLI